MPPAALANVLPFVRPKQPKEVLEPIEISLGDAEPLGTTREGSASKTELDDGSVLIDLNPSASGGVKSEKFGANLAEEIDEAELGRIANDLLRGIEADNQSRQEWLDNYAEGIKLLGLIIEDSKSGGDTSSSAPLEGMSSVRHPMLLEAVLQFQAVARGEMLPAAGPVQVRDDKPVKPLMPPVVPPQTPPMSGAPMPPPMPPQMGHNGGPPLNPQAPQQQVPPPQPPLPGPTPPTPPGNGAGPPGNPSPVGGSPLPFQAMPPPVAPPDNRDNTSDALAKDMNHYLTTTAQEYYPDTTRMLFTVGFGGLGIKKIYNCPIRRRPVSESILVEDFIVSNAAVDLANCGRYTHQIRMRPSTLRRMQLLAVYRDVALSDPVQDSEANPVQMAKAEVAGVQPTPQEPKDNDYTLFECYCELNITGYEHKNKRGEDSGLALPYRVTIERESRKVLDIRRNWKEDDPLCLAKEHFVDFAFVRAFGFYCIGLLNILGNTDKTLTAVWREFVDSGMFANFPGFVYAKGAGRQLTNQFRVPPGGGVGLDVGLAKLSDAVLPLPYKDLGPAFQAFIMHVEEMGQRLGGTANISVAEGRQDVPVGTIMAQLEQANKPIGAVLKNLHAAQSKEFQLLKERFKEDPESFWRFNKKPALPWQKEQFIKALDDYDMVPVSDPNNPTALHRAAKASILQQIAMTGILNPKKVWDRIAKLLEIDDPDDLYQEPQQGGPPPDPAKMGALQLKAKDQQLKVAENMSKGQIELQTHQMEMQDRIAERESRERIAQMEMDTERLRLAGTLAIHSDKSEAARHALTWKTASDHIVKHVDRSHASDTLDRTQAHEHTQNEAERAHALELARQQAAAASKGQS